MAIALGAQAINATPGTSATSHTVSLTVSAGDLVVLCVGVRDDFAIDSVSGSVNSYTLAGSVTRDTGSGHRAAIYYCENASAGSETITVSFGANSARAYLNASRWTGAKTSGALDQTNGGQNASGTSHTSGSVTATGSGVAVGCFKFSGGPDETDTAGFTALSQAAGGREYFAYLLNSAGAVECTVTTSFAVASAARIANFLEATAASVTITDADDETFYNGEVITVEGSGFLATRGTGYVRLCPTDDVDDVNGVNQTVNTWAAGEIEIVVDGSAFDFFDQLYLFVVNDDGDSNGIGWQVGIEPRVFIRETLVSLEGTPAANETGLVAYVWRADPAVATAHSQRLTGLTTDASGVTAWQIDRGSLLEGDPVWVAIVKDGTPYRATMRRIVPSYE